MGGIRSGPHIGPRKDLARGRGPLLSFKNETFIFSVDSICISGLLVDMGLRCCRQKQSEVIRKRKTMSTM